MKKTTLERVTYEDALLMHYKKYLQRLEKLTKSVSKGQRTSQEHRKMAEIATMCLCELLVEHPYFNFGSNIAQLLVYLSNCHNLEIRTKVMNCFQQLFREDSKFDLTLFVSKFQHCIKIEVRTRVEFIKKLLNQLEFLGCSSFEQINQSQIKYGSCGGVEVFTGIANQKHKFR